MEPLARPAHRRKLSNANGVFSFSSKNTYDDVFAAVPPSSTATAKLKPPVRVEEYGEIFGGGSRGRSSIPVLDLSALDIERSSGGEDHRSSSKKQLLDYAKIFGGFRDEDIAVPYEELVAQKSKKSSSDKAAMNQFDKESLLRGSENCGLSGKNKGHSSEASDQSLDGVKQVNMSYHKSSPRSKDGTSGTTHIAKLHAVPGFTYFIDEMANQQKTEGDRPVPKIKSEPQRTWSFSGNIHEVNNGRKTEMPMPNKLIPEGVLRGNRGSWVDGSRSNAKIFYSGEINPKSKSFRSSPSSSPPAKLNDSNCHPKRSKSSNFASKANAFEKATEYITGSSDEELDMNSAAAASAAALKKAIEQAQESIRLAKELMERKKGGFQGYSKPSSKGKNRKESRTEHEAKHIQENNSKATYEKIDDVLEGFGRRNRKTALRSDEVTTTVEQSEKPSASRKPEVEKHQRDVVQAFEETASLSDLGGDGNHRTTTLASGQMEDKITSVDKKACDFGEMKSSEETSECININVEKTKGIEQDIGIENAESRTHVLQEAKESEESIDKSGSAFKLPEYDDVSDNLKITQEDICIEDMGDGFDEWQECEKEFEESPDIIKEEKLGSPGDRDYVCKESHKVVEEKEPKETSQQECMESEPVDLLVKEEENENGLGSSCNGAAGLVQEGACQFVETDDNLTEVLSIRSCGKAAKETQEGEANERSDLIQERDIAELVLIHAYNGEETHRILDGKLKEEEDEELDVNEMEPINAHYGDKIQKLLMEEQEGKEVQLRSEETYNCLESNQNIPEEEYELGEVEKRTKDAHVNEATESLWIEVDKEARNQKVEVMQEAEEAKNVHLEADNFGNNHEIGFIQKATCNQNSKLEVQQAGRFEESNENVEASPGTVEKCADTCSTPAANDSFYQCERDVEEVGVKEAFELEEREIPEGMHSAYQECGIPSNMHYNSKTNDSDGSGANIHYNEINHADKLSVGNTFETADLVQNAVNENDVNIQPQTSEAHLFDEKSAHIASSENSRQKEIEENVGEELSSNPEITGGLLNEYRKNAENVKEVDDAFGREEKQGEIEVDNDQRSMEDDSKEAKSTTILVGLSTSNQVALETCKEMRTINNMPPAEEHLNKTGATERKEVRDTKGKDVKENDGSRKVEPNKKDRDRNTDRIAVERAIREARERAFLDARERAERAAVERAAAEVRQRQMAEARGKIGKATGGSKLVDRASVEAKMRAERAAVERATAEARVRALEKAVSQKSTTEARTQAEKLSGASRDNGLQHSFSSSDLEASSESAQRRKARLERHQRIMERAAKALEEKNMRDLQAQKEQAERNRLAETLDADIKRWASGKEGNLRALISTLQYILGPDSGWQPISLTEIITTAAVKKAYRKATLYVHPDKLQQRGASIQQKYICEKVFDLLKAAWNRFNSEER